MRIPNPPYQSFAESLILVNDPLSHYSLCLCCCLPLATRYRREVLFGCLFFFFLSFIFFFFIQVGLNWIMYTELIKRVLKSTHICTNRLSWHFPRTFVPIFYALSVRFSTQFCTNFLRPQRQIFYSVLYQFSTPKSHIFYAQLYQFSTTESHNFSIFL